MKKFILILAGGAGKRFESELPKQFNLLNGKPMLMYAFDAFSKTEDAEFILVLNEDWHQHWNQLCKDFAFTIPHRLVVGGETRFHSVQAGLSLVTNPSLVAIHDGVRPLVTPELIENCFKTAEQKSCAIPVTQFTDSIRYVSGPHNKTVAREQYRAVQTPQVFKSNLILQAYRQSWEDKFTDDSSVLESLGYPVILIAGEKENIKVTTPVDLQMAEIILKNRQ
ncbi:MAG: 2-C-methyl-D-erythritol 4-phosphate cytidylyltransferase [Bacteroidales bacterium]|nr:2-C-methyl-D-erythritol 4-phosphate cytidylyltransferase [Bacteroidales bacterium]